MNLSRFKVDAFVVLIALDALFFGGWIVRETKGRVQGTEVRLPVEGFDPRDLLSGHYVLFRLTAEQEAQRFYTPTPAQAQYCIAEEFHRYHVVGLRSEKHPCVPFISSVGVNDADPLWPKFGVDRFYIDERLADEAAFVQAGENTYLVARIDDDGHVLPVDLVLNGVSLKPKH